MSNEEIKKLTTQEFIDIATTILDKSENFTEIYLKGDKTSIKIEKDKKEIKETN